MRKLNHALAILFALFLVDSLTATAMAGPPLPSPAPVTLEVDVVSPTGCLVNPYPSVTASPGPALVQDIMDGLLYAALSGCPDAHVAISSNVTPPSP